MGLNKAWLASGLADATPEQIDKIFNKMNMQRYLSEAKAAQLPPHAAPRTSVGSGMDPVGDWRLGLKVHNPISKAYQASEVDALFNGYGPLSRAAGAAAPYMTMAAYPAALAARGYQLYNDYNSMDRDAFLQQELNRYGDIKD